ncbi:hypothetical protein SLE2022_317170 [Rubroshorea leprosula]
MGVIRSAIGDAVLTSMWVFSMPLLRIFTGIIATYLGVQAILLADLLITINLVTLMVLDFSLVGTLFGGASFNPTSIAFFYSTGLRPDFPSCPWRSYSQLRQQVVWLAPRQSCR